MLVMDNEIISPSIFRRPLLLFQTTNSTVSENVVEGSLGSPPVEVRQGRNISVVANVIFADRVAVNFPTSTGEVIGNEFRLTGPVLFNGVSVDGNFPVNVANNTIIQIP